MDRKEALELLSCTEAIGAEVNYLRKRLLEALEHAPLKEEVAA